LEKYDSALIISKQAESFNVYPEDPVYSYMMATLLLYRSVIYGGMRQYDSADLMLLRSQTMLKKNGIKIEKDEAAAKVNLASYLLADGFLEKAEFYAEEALKTALRFGYKQQVENASKILAEIYEKRGDYQSSLSLYKQYITYRDSILNIENVREMESVRADFEIVQKQSELDLVTEQQQRERLILIGVIVLSVILSLLVFLIYKYYRSKSKLNTILKNQKKELEINNATKDKFFSIISHDLRGPIASLMGGSRMIKHFINESNRESTIEVADQIEDTVQSLSELLDNLLNWATQQRGHFDYVPEKVNTREMLEDILKMYSNMSSSKNLRVNLDSKSAYYIWVDRNTTHTILRNIINNAIKFTPSGGSISVTISQNSEQGIIKIQDTGVGLSESKLKDLFKLSEKQSTFGTEGEKGLGLGLQLVKEFIKTNNGDLQVSSEIGKGTCFTISFPLFEPQHEATLVKL
ncbi:MAG: tetratricopeptide repeat-containing sensor histidine kinase, partial [Bacteroidota bacterium]